MKCVLCVQIGVVLCFWFGGILAQRIPSDVIYIETGEFSSCIKCTFNNKTFRKTVATK